MWRLPWLICSFLYLHLHSRQSFSLPFSSCPSIHVPVYCGRRNWPGDLVLSVSHSRHDRPPPPPPPNRFFIFPSFQSLALKCLRSFWYDALWCVFWCVFCCPIIRADLRGAALCRSSRDSPPPATSIADPPGTPQRSTGGDVGSLVGCHPKETLHCHRVTSVVFTSACSDWTYAGHHLLWPLLTSVLAKSRPNRTEWVSVVPRRPVRPSTNPPMWTQWWRSYGFDQNFTRGETGILRQATAIAWHVGLQKLRLFIFLIYAVIDEDVDDN